MSGVEQTAQPDVIQGIVMAVRLGVEPVEACEAAGVRPIEFWHALLAHETYVRQGVLAQLTQAQRRTLLMAILREPVGGGE